MRGISTAGWRSSMTRRARSAPPAAAEHFIERAHHVAKSLELGIAGQHRVLLLKGERLRRPDADVFLPAYDLERKA